MNRQIFAALAVTSACLPASVNAAVVVTQWSVGPALVGKAKLASKNLTTPDIYVGNYRLRGTDSVTGAMFDQVTNCVDLEHYLGTGTYQLLAASARAPGVVQLRRLTALVTNGRQQIDGAASGAEAAVRAAALQLGIWELLYETGGSFSVTAGEFSSSGGQLSSAQTLADGWLAKTVSREWRPLQGQKLAYLYHPTLQSQMFVAPMGAGDPSLGAVPEPSSWGMLIGGFALAGGALRRRRRRHAVALA